MEITKEVTNDMTTQQFENIMAYMSHLGFTCWVEGKGDGHVVIKMEKECWGCYKDWKSLHREDDLFKIKIYGQPEYVCPDCYDEIPEDGRDPMDYF